MCANIFDYYILIVCVLPLVLYLLYFNNYVFRAMLWLEIKNTTTNVVRWLYLIYYVTFVMYIDTKESSSAISTLIMMLTCLLNLAPIAPHMTIMI